MSTRIPWTAGRWAQVGHCACGATVYPDSHRDSASWHDYGITGLCQQCQDDLYFRMSNSGRGLRYPIRRGVLAAPVERDGVVVELGVFPFMFIAPEYRLAWEARYLLRAGPKLEPIDPWDALEPMRDVLHGHQVCLTEFADVAAPEVRAALDADLVVVLDGPAHAALDRLPFPVTAPRVALDAVLPWTVLYSSALLAPWLAYPATPSVLRTCALIGVAFDPDAVVPPLRFVVGAHRERFPELSWTPPDATS